MKEIQEWLAHSNYSTTANIYAYLDLGNKINVVFEMKSVNLSLQGQQKTVGMG